MEAFANTEEKIIFIEKHIVPYPDFPKKGVLFRDIFSAIGNGQVCTVLQDVLVEYVSKYFPGVEAIIGLESRGFLFSFSTAAKLGVACIPIRKSGKLPGEVFSYSYELEYGSAVFEVKKTAFSKPGTKCLIIDDLLATGGSVEAAVKLLKQCQCDVLGCLTVIELEDLKGRERLTDIIVQSIIKY